MIFSTEKQKMVSPKSRNGGSILCDFCGEQDAVLYCRADSAKLCLLCDKQVHSANQLSCKHLRSQICDNCGSEPVSVRCITDNLVLCQGCDWDAHGNCSASASHECSAVKYFSGSLSAIELASLWGFDLNYLNKKPNISDPFSHGCVDPQLDFEMSVNDGMSQQDLIVPNDNGIIYPNVGYAEMMTKTKKQSCGKQKQVMYKQLMELYKRDLKSDSSGENLDPPETPNRNGWHGTVETLGLKKGINGILSNCSDVGQQTLEPFTSLLPELKRTSDEIVDGDILWGNSNHLNDQSSQVMLWVIHKFYSCLFCFISTLFLLFY